MNTLRVRACLFLLILAGLFAFAAPRSLQAQDNKVITNSIGMKLTLIPAGKFMMGSPVDEEERDPEELQHEVVITKPFYMGVYEVTQGQFQRLMGKNKAWFMESQDHPAEQVRSSEAVDFCNRMSEMAPELEAGRKYRLPTEAEWEYACRAGAAGPFPKGKALAATDANFNGNHPYGGAPKGPYLQKTTRVGAYSPNAWGLYDMHGNVAEWCADWYDPEYYKNSPKENPKGPEKGVLSTGFAKDFYRVVRGGCWLDEARACRAAHRFRLQSTEPYRWVGLRVVCESGK